MDSGLPIVMTCNLDPYFPPAVLGLSVQMSLCWSHVECHLHQSEAREHSENSYLVYRFVLVPAGVSVYSNFGLDFWSETNPDPNSLKLYPSPNILNYSAYWYLLVLLLTRVSKPFGPRFSDVPVALFRYSFRCFQSCQLDLRAIRQNIHNAVLVSTSLLGSATW